MRLRMSPLTQAKISHPTHSAWSERKGQWPRVQCTTSPWEPRLLDRGAPVRCKFEKYRRATVAFIPHRYGLPYGEQFSDSVNEPIQ